MSNAHLIAAIALTATVTGTLVAGLTLSPPARADNSRHVACASFLAATPSVYEEKLAAWMNDQVVAGKTAFVPNEMGMCAW